MKIVVLTLHPILPEDDGFKRRVLNLYRGFPGDIDVTYISIFKPAFFIQKLCTEENIKWGSTSFSYHRSLLLKYYPKSLATKIHPLILTLQNTKLQTELLVILNKIQPHLIISESIWPLFALQDIKGFKYIIDQHNIEYLLLKREAQIMSLSKIYLKIINFRTWKNLMEQELLLIKNSQLTFIVSDFDKKVLIDNGISLDKLKIIPNGVNIQPNNETNRNNNDITNIVFMGTLDYYPNADALKIIHQKIYPLVKQKIKNVRFIIVGKNPPRWIISAAKKNHDFTVTGRVSDPNHFISLANICIAPLRSGSGTRLKILEYMALEKPVVSTTIGAEGLRVKHEENILITDDWDTFSDYIVKLTTDHKLAFRISKNAYLTAKNTYDWGAISNNMLNFIKASQYK